MPRGGGLPGQVEPGFNPRPALGPGDAPSRAQPCRAEPVSIRARHWGRAMPTFRRARNAAGMFQSAPGTGAGRCAISPTRKNCRDGVSIRARHWGRAMPGQPFYPGGNAVFQSAPGTGAGRCGDGRQRVAGSACSFQSAPGTGAGRCRTPSSSPQRSRQVSIRARHWGRAMHGNMTSDFGVEMFQSAPGTGAGRCRPRSSRIPTHLGVSIRARHWGRAMPPPVEQSSGLLLFQSAPGTGAGRCASAG